MPTEAQVRARLIRKHRRDILGVLKMVYPGQFAFADVALSLPTIEERNLRVDLSYLVDKGYVTWCNRQPNMGVTDGEFKLTPAGVETADRINEDPALEP